SCCKNENEAASKMSSSRSLDERGLCHAVLSRAARLGQPPARDRERSQAASAVDHLPGLARRDADRADRLPGRRTRIAEDGDDHHPRVRAPFAEWHPATWF